MDLKKDIKGRNDIKKLVKHFYSIAMPDPIIGFFFTQVSPIDLDVHVEKVTDFWCAIIFGYDPLSDSKSGKAIKQLLNVHREVDGKARIQTGHFTRWLHLFFVSIDVFYEGERANALKDRATKMASSMSDALRSGRGEDRVGVESLR